MLNTMSKLLCMGMPLNEVIYRSTVTPAQEIGHPQLGTLSIGAEADIAVLRQETGEFGYVDCGYARMTGDRKLTCDMTIRAGEIVYDLNGRSTPAWEKRPAGLLANPLSKGNRLTMTNYQDLKPRPADQRLRHRDQIWRLADAARGTHGQ